MDGGRSINILYKEAFRQMKLCGSALQPSNTIFRGIVSGKKAHSMGRVVFGNDNKICLEKISFEVVNFKSAYHAIFCRPTFKKFMACPCYACMKLKMSGPNGTITISGDVDKAIECEKAISLVYSVWTARYSGR